MFRRRKLFSTIRVMFFMVLASFGLTSCADEPKLKKPPFELPFDAGSVGSKTNFEVEIIEKNEYLLGIVFFIKKTPEEAIRVGKILGASQQIGPAQWVEYGVPATFLVQIYKQPGNEELLNKLVDHPKTRPEDIGRTADIVRIILVPGSYSIKIEYIQGASELASLPSKISFSRAHHGK